MKKSQIVFMLLSIWSLAAFAQESDPENIEDTFWRKDPILENIAFQDEVRSQHRFYGGVGLGSFTMGYHLRGRWGISLYYHPHNQFEEGDPIGLGFGEGTAGGDYYNARIYNQTGIEAFENLDKHTIVGGVRYYVLSSFFVGTGLAIQTGSSREVRFEARTREIGRTTYDQISAVVETKLKDQFTPYLAIGFHHQIGRLGLFAEGNFGFNNKKLEETTIQFSQEVAPEDHVLFRQEVRRGAESEGFGIATAGLSFSF